MKKRLYLSFFTLALALLATGLSFNPPQTQAANFQLKSIAVPESQPSISEFQVQKTEFVAPIDTGDQPPAPESNFEIINTPNQCSDGIDNDGDGKIDSGDKGCLAPNQYGAPKYDPNQNNEAGCFELNFVDGRWQIICFYDATPFDCWSDIDKNDPICAVPPKECYESDSNNNLIKVDCPVPPKGPGDLTTPQPGKKQLTIDTPEDGSTLNKEDLFNIGGKCEPKAHVFAFANTVKNPGYAQCSEQGTWNVKSVKWLDSVPKGSNQDISAYQIYNGTTQKSETVSITVKIADDGPYEGGGQGGYIPFEITDPQDGDVVKKENAIAVLGKCAPDYHVFLTANVTKNPTYTKCMAQGAFDAEGLKWLDSVKKGSEQVIYGKQVSQNSVVDGDDQVTVIIADDAQKPECSDGKDNDNDGKVDQKDPGCWLDPGDPGSYDPNDDDEKDPTDKPECSDGKDNDNDGKIDKADPECHTDGDPGNGDSYNPGDNDEGGDNGSLPYDPGKDYLGDADRECLKYNPLRNLTFVDVNDLNAAGARAAIALKNTYLSVDNIAQYLLSGYGSDLQTTGKRVVGMNDTMKRIEFAKLVMLSHCLPVLDEDTLPNVRSNGDPMISYHDLSRSGNAPSTLVQDIAYTIQFYSSDEEAAMRGTDEGNFEPFRAITLEEIMKPITVIQEFRSGKLSPEDNSGLQLVLNRWSAMFYAKANYQHLIQYIPNALIRPTDNVIRKNAFDLLIHAMLQRNLYNAQDQATVSGIVNQ